MYQMAQGIVDTFSTLTVSLHHSKNKFRWSCLQFPAVSPQPVTLPKEPRLWCTAEAKRERKKAEPRRHGGRPTLVSNAGIAYEYSPTFADANAYVHVGPRPLRILRVDSRLRHPPFNQMSPLPTTSPSSTLLHSPQCRRRPPFPLGRRILSAPTVWRACERGRRWE